MELTSYKKMVTKHAWWTWRHLPRQTRTWLDIEDLIWDGMRWLYVDAVHRWDPKKATFSTFFYNAIKNYYFDHYTQVYGKPEKKGRKRYGSMQGYEGNVVSIDDAVQAAQERGRKDLEFEKLFRVMFDRNFERKQAFLADCIAVQQMAKMFRTASPFLHVEMKKWFMTPINNPTKFSTSGMRFTRARDEFRELAKENDVGILECRHLIWSPSCLDTLHRQLYGGLPYDFDNPDPRNAEVFLLNRRVRNEAH